MNYTRKNPAEMRLVTVWMPSGIDTATGWIAKDKVGRYYWGIRGIGICGDTGFVQVPFEIPHDDFASWIARAYFDAIANEVGGGDYGLSVALKICFDYRRNDK